MHFNSENQHLRSYFRDLSSGATYRDQDLTEELRLDWDELTMPERKQVRDVARKADREIKALRADGHFQKARQLADESAAEVRDLVGERLTPKPKRKDPVDPRGLAALVKRWNG